MRNVICVNDDDDNDDDDDDDNGLFKWEFYACV